MIFSYKNKVMCLLLAVSGSTYGTISNNKVVAALTGAGLFGVICRAEYYEKKEHANLDHAMTILDRAKTRATTSRLAATARYQQRAFRVEAYYLKEAHKLQGTQKKLLGTGLVGTFLILAALESNKSE
jgi:hypothetical protein